MGDKPHTTAPDARRKVSAAGKGRPIRIKEEEIPTEINADSGASRGATRNFQVGSEERHVRVKEEEFQIEIDTSGFSNQIPPASAARPLYSPKSTAGNQNMPQGYQEARVRGPGQFKEEEIPLEIGQDGSYTRYPGQRGSRNSTQGNPSTPHGYQGGNMLKVEVKEEQIPSQIAIGYPIENQNSQMIVTDPLEGRSRDSRFYDEEEMPDEEYSYSMDSESDERFTDESEETDDSEDLSPSPLRARSESLENFLAMLQEQVCPSHLPEPPCFQNDPVRDPADGPNVSEVKEENLVGHTDWCECGKCQAMPANSDCLCCRKVENTEEYLLGGVTCVTMSEEFHNRCLNEKVLRYLLEYDRSTTRRDYVEDKNRCFRRAAYRSYTRMIHGFRKKRAFVPIPSCVVTAIRDRFPDPKPYAFYSLDYPASYVAMSVVERG